MPQTSALDSKASAKTDGYGSSYTNTLVPLQRLHSLAFGFGTFAYAKDRASLPHDGLLKDNPPPSQAKYKRLFYAGFAQVTVRTYANQAWVGCGMEKWFRFGWAASITDRGLYCMYVRGRKRSRAPKMNILNIPHPGQHLTRDLQKEIGDTP